MACKNGQINKVNQTTTEKQTKYNSLTRAFNIFGQHYAETAESKPTLPEETSQTCQKEQLVAEYWRSIVIQQIRQHIII